MSSIPPNPPPSNPPPSNPPPSNPPPSSTPCSDTLKKRNREGKKPAGEPDLKKRRTNDQESIGPCGLHDQPTEIIERIVSFLRSPRDVASFEETCKAHINYTEHYWRQKIQHEGLDLTSPLDQVKSAKERYLFSKIVFKNLPPLWPVTSYTEAMRIYPQDKWVGKSFPHLYQFLASFIHQKTSTAPSNPFLPDRLVQQKVFLSQEPGHLIMQALLESSPEKAYELFGLAAKEQPAAAYLAVTIPEIPSPSNPGQFKKNCIDLAISAADQGNYCALDHCLKRWPDLVDTLISAQKNYPPVLFQKACSLVNSRNFSAANTHIQNAIEGYKQSAPARVLKKAIEIKVKLDNWKEAELLIPLAMAAFELEGISLSSDFLSMAGEVKHSLHKYSEAESLYEQAVKAYKSEGKAIPATLFPSLAHTKEILAKEKPHKLEEAESLYEQAFSAFALEKRNIPSWVLHSAASNKSKLQKYSDAESLFEQTFKAYESEGKAAPVSVLRSAAANKTQLQKYSDAESLFEQAIKAYESAEEAIPIRALQEVAYVKKKLHKYSEVESLYIQVIEACESKKKVIPAKLYLFLATVKEKLNKPEEAAQLRDLASSIPDLEQASSSSQSESGAV